MECKVFPVLYCSDWDADWNISRMECKVTIKAVISRSITIGIYPEWNVKDCLNRKNSLEVHIGIYPEWNVKNAIATNPPIAPTLEYIQNGM